MRSGFFRTALNELQDERRPEEPVIISLAPRISSILKLIESSPKKPLRIFTHVSENNLRPKDPRNHHNGSWPANAPRRR